MQIPLLTSYFTWLQKDNPTGTVEVYPELDTKFQSSVLGVYIVGDLTGIPLLKLAAQGGSRVVRQMQADKDFLAARKNKASENSSSKKCYDILIIGGGPSGVACALECEKQGLDYLLLESQQLFQTLENFPKGKPILAKPDEWKEESPLIIRDGTKESLLADLRTQLADKKLKVQTDIRVEKIVKEKEYITLQTSQEKFHALRVVVAIGKSGDARKLNIAGEEKPFVFNRLFDAAEYKSQNIMVIGGGDSALEASIALAEAGNRVSHAYRKVAFERPKAENLLRFNQLSAEGKIIIYFASEPLEIRDHEVLLKQNKIEKMIPVDAVFTLIGRELPKTFFKRSNIRLQGEREASWFVFLCTMLSFFTMLYFGKSGQFVDLFSKAKTFPQKILAYLAGPFPGLFGGQHTVHLSWSLDHYAWYSSLNLIFGWLGSLVFLISGSVALTFMLRQKKKYFGSTWAKIKYGYFIAVAIGFTGVYFRYVIGRNTGWSEEPTYYYSLLYCVTMLLFGLRRIYIRKSTYIRLQTTTLIFVQVFFLFLLPFYLYEGLLKPHLDPNGYVLKEMFPAGKWSSFGFILFWPLDINDFGSSTFWTWFPFVQTFGILFFLVKQYGKGAYCGWICSCGGMAETLGDEYRNSAPHGKKAKSLENMGQIILAFAFAVTLLHFASQHISASLTLAHWADTIRGIYKMSVDVFFAGVLGLGVYFFYSGRIWCRYGCPLAAIMHIYSRFSRYRIFAEKKKCISCNICTKVCHMGIDVMGFANKGIPLNDVECVRCSACVNSCPTEVLSFGKIASIDVENKTRQELPEYGKLDWRAGIKK